MDFIFNFWRNYPRFKPKKEAAYLCTLEDGSVMILYYSEWVDEWIDSSRQSVFDGYQVYMSGRGQIEDTRVYSDGLCDRTRSVMAWKKLPKRKGWWWK